MSRSNWHLTATAPLVDAPSASAAAPARSFTAWKAPETAPGAVVTFIPPAANEGWISTKAGDAGQGEASGTSATVLQFSQTSAEPTGQPVVEPLAAPPVETAPSAPAAEAEAVVAAPAPTAALPELLERELAAATEAPSQPEADAAPAPGKVPIAAPVSPPGLTPRPTPPADEPPVSERPPVVTPRPKPPGVKPPISEAPPGRIIVGGKLSDVLQGTPARDKLFGKDGDDELRAGDGDDELFGGRGNNLLIGGRGFDTAHMEGSAFDYYIQRGEKGRATVELVRNGVRGTNLLQGVEQIAFEGRTVFLDGTNNAPLARSDRGLWVQSGKTLRVPMARLTANDLEFDGDKLKIVSIGAVCCGRCPGGVCRTGYASIEGDEIVFRAPQIQWALAEGDRIEETYAYTVSDGKGGTDTRSVTFVILKPGAKPTQSDLKERREVDSILTGERRPQVTFRPPVTRVPTTEPAPGLKKATAESLLPTTTTTSRLAGGAVTAYGLWDDAAVPTTLADPDTLPVELGMKFRADMGGTITGIRFYKSAANTGTHVGNLWTATGINLGSVVFTGETASGWQTAYFATPIAIDPDTTYVASYHAPNGGYSVDAGYFSSARTVGALTALDSASAGGNGVYGYGPSSFPTSSYAASNYWVDVLYETDGTSNRRPVAGDDSGFATAIDAVLRIPVATLLANDTDPDGDLLTITGVTSGAGGTAVLDTVAGEVVFTPSAAFEGFADFTYTVEDPSGASDTAKVEVTVGSPPLLVSLWDDSVTPTVTSANDTQGVELGVRFTSSSSGVIRAIRFYKGPFNTGTHVGNLWTATGQNLGSVQFSNETATGWQTATFAQPIHIDAGATYVASYYAPNGGYAIDAPYFTNSWTNDVLTAPADADVGGNGVFRYGGASAFPSSSWNAGNYWVDVVFEPDFAAGELPTAGNDAAATDEDTPIVISVLGNDSDPAGGSLTVSQLDLSNTRGYATINPDNTISYDPRFGLQSLAAGETVTDYFTYRVTNDLGGTADATVAVTVTGIDDPVNAIVLENAKPGNPQSEWQIDGDGSGIEGFATDISVDQGGRVGFKVNTTATNYRLDIYRMGYYGGMGARKVATVEPSLILANGQAAPQHDAATGLYDAGNWLETAHWQVPEDATSGVYFAKLVREDGVAGSNHVYFVVRDDDGGSDMLFQTADTTWQAYNRWGGNSLYNGDPSGRAFKLSYNRPFGDAGHPVNTPLFDAEYPMIRWLEANGYDVSYFTGIDSDRHGAEILEHDVFLSVGHDEYWSGQQRANVEAARDAGVNLAFFAGNDVYWKIRWEADAQGNPYRTLVSYKETWANDKIDPSAEWTGTWRDPRFSPPSDGGRPENELIGTIFTVDSYRLDTMTIPAEYGRARFWRNTGIDTLAPGTEATLTPNVLGYEWNEDLDNGFRPEGAINLSSTTIDVGAYIYDYGNTVGPGTGTHEMTLYRAPGGALVFSAGSTRWSWGLDSNHINESSVVDPRMQQATVNLFADMGVQAQTLQSGLAPAFASTDVTAPVSQISSPTDGSTISIGSVVTVTGTASDIGGVVAGVEVSTDGGTTWHEAQGRESWSYTWKPSTIGTYQVLARAVDDSLNIGTPGSPVDVSVEFNGNGISIWNDSVVPTVTAANDGSAVELGMKFRSSVGGLVTGIRFYKGATNIGTHVGSLWTADGTQLASTTFSAETQSGWQTSYFDTPINIAPDTTYVASYFAPNGNYSADTDYFSTSGATSGPLTALSSPESGGNGLYAYGPSRFPGNSFRSSNYWVDVVFEEVTAGA